MRIEIITIGAPGLDYAKDGFALYVERLMQYHKVQITHIKDTPHAPEKVLTAIGKQFCVLADENGKELSSTQVARFLEECAIDGRSDVAVVIGGPDGHAEVVRARADVVWSFGALTLPHDLAMVVAAEALYRASTITAGHPYHRN